MLAFLMCIVAALGALAYVLGSGYGMPMVEEAAENALERIVPPGIEARLGKTDVALVWPEGFGITYNDVVLERENDGKTVFSADRITLAVRGSSVLAGAPEFSSISVNGAVVDAMSGAPGALPKLRIADAEQAVENLFSNLGSVSNQLFRDGNGTDLKLADVKFLLPENGYSGSIDIRSLAITADGGSALIDGELLIDGRSVPVEGALHDPSRGKVNNQPGEPLENVTVDIKATKVPMPWRRLQTIVSNDLSDHMPDKRHDPLLADVSLRMTDGPVGGMPTTELSVVPHDMAFKLAQNDYVSVDGAIAIEMDFATPAITVLPSRWRIGRSSFTLNGRVRDSVASDMPNRFEFELLANTGVAAAGDSPESPVRFAARSRGIANLDERRIKFTKLDVNSEAGEMNGEGQISLGSDIPTAVFKVFADDMSIAGVKQFWPSPVARGARRWVLNNLAGGRVIKGQFDIAEPLRRRIDGTDRELNGATEVALEVEGVRFDVTGNIPPVRDADGKVSFVGGVTRVTLEKGTVFLPSGRTADARDGVLIIQQADEADGLIRANLDLAVSGEAKAVGELITFNPINADSFYSFSPTDLSGQVQGNVIVDFVLNGGAAGPQPDWSVDFEVSNAGSDADIEGRQLSALDGRIQVDPRRAAFDLDGKIDGLPAEISMIVPFGGSDVTAKRDIKLNLGTEDRKKIAPGLEEVLTGVTPVSVLGSGGSVRINADLTPAQLELPWIGWAKGKGVKADAEFDLAQSGDSASITDFKLSGGSFGASGEIEVKNGNLSRIRFGSARLTKDDNFSVDVQREGAGFLIDVAGKSMDGRALMRHIRAEARKTEGNSDSASVTVAARIDRVQGFHEEVLTGVRVDLRVEKGNVTSVSLRGTTRSGFPVFLDLKGVGAKRQIKVETLGAGEVLRFADIYTNVRGGTLNVSLNGSGGQTLAGKADIRDFRVFNEPKLAQLVSSRSENSQSLEQAVNKQIDTSEVAFEVASSDLVFKPGRLDISQAVARGPLAGFTIQGKVFDSNNQTRLTGTFLPAYGLNRLFGEIPILGIFLGNGRDRGLIGVTFKLEGSFDDPNVVVNPLSVIAPGIFRSIFEFQ